MQSEDEYPFRRSMSLSDWTFVLGVPDSERGFEHASAVGQYCLGYADWNDYENRFLSHFRKTILPLEQVGLQIVREATVKQFGRQLTETRGVILFSHCDYDKNEIEFSDGMQPYTRIMKLIRPDFCGIIDVSVCAPKGIYRLIKARAPGCGVRMTEVKTWPAMWFRFTAYLLTEFAVKDCSYAQAILTASALFRPTRDS